MSEEQRDAHLRLVWNTLMFFASESSYTTGERTGGVLQGCPRKPPPTEAELAGYSQRALASLLQYLGKEPEEWMTAGAYHLPSPPTIPADVGRRAMEALKAGVGASDGYGNALMEAAITELQQALAAPSGGQREGQVE